MSTISLDVRNKKNLITLHQSQDLSFYLKRILMAVATIALCSYVIITQTKINRLEQDKTEAAKSYRALLSETSKIKRQHEEDINILQNDVMQFKTSVQNNIESANKTIEELNMQLMTLRQDNETIMSEYDELREQYSVLESRKELYDKYEYVVTYGGKRTEVSYEQIKTGEELMKKYGYNPHILFSIIMVESRGTANAVNRRSNATGYGQFLASTGKFTYETLLNNGKGTYTHSMAKNGDTNIQMTVAYLNYLLNYYNGDLYRTMKNYSGNSTMAGTRKYMTMMNEFSSKTGNNIFQIANNKAR